MSRRISRPNFLLEISPEESILRRKNEIPDRIESGIKFLEKVNTGFKLIAKKKLESNIGITK